MVKARKQAEYHWDKGDVSWMPAPPPKKQEKPKKKKSAVQKAVERNKKLEDLINQL